MTAAHSRGDGLYISLWTAVSVGIFANAYLPIGYAGWCVRSAAGLLWPAAAGLGLAVIINRSLRHIEGHDLFTRVLLAFAALCVAALAILDLVPPIARDELTHHLAMPELYVRAGRIVEVPFADQAYYPMLLEMLYTPIVARGWEISAKYLHLGFGVASSALLLAYLHDRGHRALAVLSAVLLLTTPTVAVLAASAYVDLGLLFYTMVAVLAVLRWSETQRPSYFILSALGAGCAASVKYNGMLLIPLLGLFVLLVARERGTVAAMGLAIAFGLISLGPLLPWLIKNAAETGNPIFPLFNDAIGGRPLPDQPSIDVFTKRRLLYGESWLEIALTPIRLFVTGREGDPVRFDGVFNPLYLFAFAVSLLPAAERRERWLAGLAAVLLFTVVFLSTLRSRYAISVLVPLAVLVPSAVNVGLKRWRTATVAAIAIALLFNAWHLVMFWTSVDPLAYLSGRESRSEFITRFIPEYPIVEKANEMLPTAARVDLEFLGSRGYYWASSYTYDTYFSGTTLRDAIQESTTGDDVATKLRAKGITHLAAASGLLLRFLRDNLTEIEYKCWEDFAREHLRPVYDHQGFGLYEIV